VTAAATDTAGSTSEFSACVQVTVSSTPVITSATPANGMPGEGYLALRGANLPSGVGDVLAFVVTGGTTQNGAVYFGASSPTAVYVRMPAGQPLGASTVQLTNVAGTIVSNAFPVTLTAVPGTPVITQIRDGSLAVVSGPVAAGSTIYVGADGIDSTGAVVRFTQGATTWDVTGVLSSNPTIGTTLQVNVPGDVATGPIDVSIRQGASAFSAPVTIAVTNPSPLDR
jgi:hypothetical protein